MIIGNCISKLFPIYFFSGDIRFYLDATDFQQEGYYYWEHTGKNLTYTNWHGNEPQGGKNQNCIWKFGVNINYEWIDISCFEPAAYMCEKEGN
ncbi:hypothetical protein FSP39_020766 [Pinctada imbricata]|uniref:C-type lectin domain-containing protein n=1 Tax=Pinctada imbricata TaxID=66713 RepID=A0AA88Y621_PINIB|nr:hypothetical protein FSP39_020766 [Pinctada imbricata]